VDQIDACAGRDSWQKLLFAANPFDSAASINRNRDCGGEFVPRATGCFGGLTIDEGRDSEVWPFAHQRGNQFPRVGLHPARLAGNEVDQVQADVHRRWTARLHGSLEWLGMILSAASREPFSAGRSMSGRVNVRRSPALSRNEIVWSIAGTEASAAARVSRRSANQRFVRALHSVHENTRRVRTTRSFATVRAAPHRVASSS
jgi:hypothetical protein